MKIANKTYSIAQLKRLQPVIDPSPQYQRGQVWRLSDKQLLIDSILRGYDIPKLYLRKTSGAIYQFEVADGQQRLRSIWEYLDDVYPLAAECTIPGCAGSYFTDLSHKHQKRIEAFKLVVAIALTASSTEIRDLFQRLQRGMQLSQPEIRNAIPSQLGTVIRTISETHAFFRNSPFSAARYKTDDLVAHAFLLETSGEKGDLKAPDLRDMYRDYATGIAQPVERRVVATLDIMSAMQAAQPKCISRKWGFVDVYWTIAETSKNALPKPDQLARRYVAFERRRLSFVSRPEDLLKGKHTADDKRLFDYIEAFKTSGGLGENVRKRHDILKIALIGAP
jgi:hypothetical protein